MFDREPCPYVRAPREVPNVCVKFLKHIVNYGRCFTDLELIEVISKVDKPSNSKRKDIRITAEDIIRINHIICGKRNVEHGIVNQKSLQDIVRDFGFLPGDDRIVECRRKDKIRELAYHLYCTETFKRCNEETSAVVETLLRRE